MAEAEAGGEKTVQEQCVELLNQSALLSDPAEKLVNLKKVQELIIHQDPALLDNFLDEVVAFQTDISPDVRRSVICFIEEACKKDNEMVPKVVANLCILLQDSFSVAVVKRTIQAISCIYKIALQWLSSSRSVSEVMDSAWTMLCRMKQQILTYFDHDNDGVRTMAVKFMETLVLLQTYSESDGMKRADFCLDGVPITLKIARPRKLEEEARNVFNQMLKFHGSPHISSVNLMACMSAITLIARFRPSFLNQVISAMESLHANLPPTLSKSQVNSVRKHMKMQLLNLLKQPASYDSHQNICTLLTDLGASQSEVMRAMPPPDEVKKRQRRAAADSSADKDVDRSSSKRPKISTAADDDDEDEYEDQIAAVKRPAHDVDKRKHKANAIDITESWVVDRLTASVAANLVLVSMHLLPETVPPQFSSTFTPIAAAGTPSQIRHVSRLLSAQLTHVGIGPGVEATRNCGVNMTELDWEMEEEEEDNDSSRHTISTVLGGSVVDNKQPPTKKEKIALLPSGQIKRHMVRALKLQDITHALPRETTDRLMNDALDRFMRSEKVAQGGGLAVTHIKLLTMMSAHFSDHLIEKLLAHILEDIRGRSDLCIAWLFEEYSSMLGFSNFGLLVKSESKYEQIICMLVSALMCRPDLSDGEALLSRLYLEAPVIPDSAIDILKGFTADADHHVRGIALLHALAVRRPPKQLAFIAALLDLTNHQHEGVQTRAMQAVLELHGVAAPQAAAVEEHAVDQLKYLTLPEPPSLLLMNLQQSGGPPPAQNKQWTDDLVKMCLRMYLALLPKNESLIHELARVYVQTAADVKRTILRVVEMPVRGMGMQSPELLSLVEQCPKGAETLVTRVIHILTDKTPPSADLVDRVRDLYQKRVSDVRFLIPVLNGLTKREVIAALPKLIKLNPVVVKEVFNRLLGIHADTANFSSPITPEDLLVALHNIDPAKCDMKTIIKATSLCFTEKHVYTQEVLAVVLQQLMDQDPLPTLLMRTVIQSLALYNRLIGFVMNILQRLITREVWNQKRVWEGFIKCCQRTRPSSYQVLLQLPAEPLGQVFEAAPEMRQQMLDFVNNFNEAQRAHVPDEIMSLITSGTLVKSELNAEPMSPPEIDSIDPLQVIQRRHIKEEPTEELSIAAEDY